MAEKTSVQNEKVYCRFHKQETYQLYCKDCRDCVCFVCLDENHLEHSFCRLRDADNDIMNEFKSLLTNKIKDDGEINFIREKHIETIARLKETERELNLEIENSAKHMVNNIQDSKSQLVSSISDMFSKYANEIQEAQRRTEDLGFDIASIGVDRLDQLDFWQVVKTLSDLKQVLVEGDKTFEQFQIPRFEPNPPQTVGSISTLIQNESEDRKELSLVRHVMDVSTQTNQDEPEDADTDDEWFDADDILEEFLNESLSDEIRDVFPIKIIIENNIKLVHKIIPVSDTDAWILTDRNLRKVIGHNLDKTVYSENVDDIAVTNKGDVLVLNKANDFIMRLLPDKRLVRFWGTDHVKKTAYCICTTKENSIFICVGDLELRSSGHRGHHVIRMNDNGVEVSRTFYSTYCSPNIILSQKSNMCLIYRYDYCPKFKLQLRTPADKIVAEYTGVFGFDPRKNFVCHGICTDNTGDILVSDYVHHSVYTLDNNLKFKNCIVDARDGLNNPTAIALHENRLWVADGQNILIFEYHDNTLKSVKVSEGKET